MKWFKKKCIWEIRTDNPSLAVKILNATPRPILINIFAVSLNKLYHPEPPGQYHLLSIFAILHGRIALNDL